MKRGRKERYRGTKLLTGYQEIVSKRLKKRKRRHKNSNTLNLFFIEKATDR